MGISLFNILIAFAGGLLSFLSPCVLPLVPGYISLMSGVSVDHLKEGAANSRRAVIANSLSFNPGPLRDISHSGGHRRVYRLSNLRKLLGGASAV